eukprot:GHVO01021452.1.p1 GENE.GHVO01021452.1~~GHVO01021452.1.p1  ORF type:complete len:157 (-),score=14.53 GHVO01021452.1:11-481(-)
MRYICRTYAPHLLGKTPEDAMHVDMVTDVLVTHRQNIVGVVYCPKADYETRLAKWENGPCTTTLTLLSKYLGEKDLFIRDITLTDFVAWETLDQTRMMTPDTINKFPNLYEYIKRFAAIPKIQAYLKSDRFREWPLNNKSAAFGGNEKPNGIEKLY